jgi:hypothetical protein
VTKPGLFEQNKKNMPFNVTWLNAIVQILDSYLMPVMAKTQLIYKRPRFCGFAQKIIHKT